MADELDVLLDQIDNPTLRSELQAQIAKLRSRRTFGLLGMRERATMLGGHLEFGNAPGSGARLTVRLPLGTRPRQGTFVTAGDGI